MSTWLMIVVFGASQWAYSISEPMPTEDACKLAIERITDAYGVLRWEDPYAVNPKLTKCVKITK